MSYLRELTLSIEKEDTRTKEGAQKVLSCIPDIQNVLDILEEDYPPGRERSLMKTNLQEALLWGTSPYAQEEPGRVASIMITKIQQALLWANYGTAEPK